MAAAAVSPTSNRYLVLPDAPSDLSGPVKAWRESVTILTYVPEEPTPNPMFLEKRVYQGSSGKVYPLPFIDRIATEPIERAWDALHIENEYIRLMVLPELGGRIHIGYDKRNGYDFFYRQNVIKPALVGLAGPWASGGVEFNWPQHHRPATFMAVETAIEQSPDGSVTVWCSDHDPMLRMKGMHGIRLIPGHAMVELRARLYNRAPHKQTFLWWANVATRVHEQYQSFFPTDVRYVADHARRAITTFPRSDRAYYGIDYAQRAATGVPEDEAPASFRPDGSYPANDLSWYANIPVPTSYMITGTDDDFFGGYDHRAKAGMVHVANHHIAPGKKQWTWGNHDFGYAWDRSLTDDDGPYIELMAGVYTDNQPDFSWLAPWETKTFSQYWYPIQDLGVPQAANTQAAIHVENCGNETKISIAVTASIPNANVEIRADGKMVEKRDIPLHVDNVFHWTLPTTSSSPITVAISASGRTILEYDPASIVPAPAPTQAKEPRPANEVETVEELFLIGLHLLQYRHATRQPELYWNEALHRDPGDARTNNACGLLALSRGEFTRATENFQRAIDRLTSLNPNPQDSEPFYNLGLTLRYLGKIPQAYKAFYKATWSAAWRGPAYMALAEIDASRHAWTTATDHLQRTLKADADNLNARNLLAYVARQQAPSQESERLLSETAHLDPLDLGWRWESGRAPRDGQQIIDLALDLSRSGRTQEAIKLLRGAGAGATPGSEPILLLLLADLEISIGESGQQSYELFRSTSLSLCFPHRLEELLLLERAAARHPDSMRIAYLLGNLLYDKQRYHEAIICWEKAVALDPNFPTAWRNLGIAYFNIANDSAKAVSAFDYALKADPSDGRILYERDQLWKRIGRTPQQRLDVLLSHMNLVASRDDLTVELATVHNQLGNPQRALELILARRFQPWEGGEGLVLGQYIRAHLLLGQSDLQAGNPQAALLNFQLALTPPQNLGEAKHLLANQSNIYYYLGRSYAALSDLASATHWFTRAASVKGDFQQMSVRTVSDMSFWTALALSRLGQAFKAKACLDELLAYGKQLEETPAKIDYFASSLPAMLLFNDNLDNRNHIAALFLQAQAHLGLNNTAAGEHLLKQVLTLDINHMDAQDLLTNASAFNSGATA